MVDPNTNTYAHRAQRQKTDDNTDFYPTPPWATRALMEYGLRYEKTSEQCCLEPACGQGHMAEPLKDYFCQVDAADLVDRGYPFTREQNFLTMEEDSQYDWVITNPPFSLAEEFVTKAMLVASRGIAIFARTQLLEGKSRYSNLYSVTPPSLVMPFVERVPLVKNRLTATGSTATSYSWFVWNKMDQFSSTIQETKVRWIPPCRKHLEREGDYDET